ncbi:uncharacterized protein ACA1_208540 [Acanthamoeba castellanii str. Neff]|uniref:Uncharacterized protein n=1 Tax=Acanthamoeba castellanii (strain ATCC 30010 / Neff) TaxID=1257118 RepID=L8GYA4_ACACF|nr:uncharacterized protein ACA1_208540 [Acanthamoeba castellanii str. Neff]ELR17975.1 hypothetical protein ACA1_208540 [Acanthamoeba castellanii str. Neff]
MTAIATVVLPSMSSTSDVEKPKKKGKKKFQKMNDINQVDLLSLFFAQYQTFEERFQLRPTTTTTYDVYEDEAVLLELNVEKMKKKDKGKEKMTEEEEQAAREEEESGEEGLLIDSLHEDEDEDDTSLDLFSDDLHCFDDQDEVEAYLDLFDDVEAEDYVNHYNLPDLDHYAGLDFDMVETDDDVALENEGEHWERRVVSSKLGGHVVRRHSRSHKKPRVRPGRWVNARDERRRCERVGLVFEQVCAYKANATRGLEYRTIDYQAIRQDVVIPSTSSSIFQVRYSHHYALIFLVFDQQRSSAVVRARGDVGDRPGQRGPVWSVGPAAQRPAQPRAYAGGLRAAAHARLDGQAQDPVDQPHRLVPVAHGGAWLGPGRGRRRALRDLHVLVRGGRGCQGAAPLPALLPRRVHRPVAQHGLHQVPALRLLSRVVNPRNVVITITSVLSLLQHRLASAWSCCRRRTTCTLLSLHTPTREPAQQQQSGNKALIIATSSSPC